MTEVADALLHELHASRERLLEVLAGVSEEQFKRKPPVEAVAAAGDWSISELLAHLLATEQRRTARFEALLAGEAPQAEALTAEERNAEARLGRTVPVPQIIHGLLAARRRLERALTESTGLPADAAALLRAEVIQHERDHTAQVEAVKAVLPARAPPPSPP